MPSLNPQPSSNPQTPPKMSPTNPNPNQILNLTPQHSGPEIAFFDTETSVPSQKGEGYALLEFGAVLVCPKTLAELFSYSTLIKPRNLDVISVASVRCNGITREEVGAAPGFDDVADDVYNILHGRIWAGHNIIRFDCPRIKEAFAEIGRPAPEPKGFIDTLPLLTQKFGRRAGNMKLASLASYFSLGRQSHRSFDDVKMNIDVVKNCATVLFLEECLPNVLAVPTPLDELPITRTDTSILVSHIEEIKLDSTGTSTSTNAGTKSYTSVPLSEPSGSFSNFLDPSEISPQQITVSPLPFSQFAKPALFHKNSPLQLFCGDLRVRFGVSDRFTDGHGKPKLSFVVDLCEKVCGVLERCDELAMRWSEGNGSGAQWRPIVKKNGFVNLPTVRIHIPTINGGEGIYSTEILKKEPSGSFQKLMFSRLDTSALDTLFIPGNILDAFISLDLYDYQQNAGIRLVAKRLILK